METKQQRIAELEKQLFDIQNKINKVNGEPQDNFALIKVVPDCGAGIRDDETILAISEDKENLILYCEQEHNYTPDLSDNRRKDGAKPCDTWYKLRLTKIQLIGYPVT